MRALDVRQRIGATKIGVDVQTYRALAEIGWKRCSGCRTWHPQEQFSPSLYTADGLSGYCRAANARAAAQSRARRRAR